MKNILLLTIVIILQINSAFCESILIITGAAAMAVSIALFIASGKNKQKTKLMLTFQKGAEGLPVALSKKISGLTFTIPM